MAGPGAPPVNRNAPCPCGSGKRYKHCCGREAAAPVIPTRSEALAAHRSGSLRQAETLYRRALAENPDDVDVIHMLGVVMLERLRYREALDLIFDAAERSGWANAQIRHNLGLAVAKLLVRDVNARQTSLVDAFVAWERAHAVGPDIDPPLVSVVMRAYNHARFIGEAIASVAAQAYPKLELVIVDEASTDGTAETIARMIEGLPFPVRFVARSRKGAPATLNEAAAMASGAYLSFLDPDDYYAPDRVAAMVDGITRPGLAWGFSLVATVTTGAPATAAAVEAPAGSYWQVQRSLLGSDSNSFALVQNNVAVSTGNLFVARDFFASLGGFRELRYNHDFHGWDFCLRAAALAEPMVVRRPLYFCRMHGANTIRESEARAIAEADQVRGELIASILSGATRCTNPLAPQWPDNRNLLLTRILGAGQGAFVPVAALRELALSVRAGRSASRLQAAAGAPAPSSRTAIVVLGMHRSGTSAFARVLNLCGAFLPAELRPANVHDNPTGFWEPEAIINLNDRVLRQQGGAWNQVAFVLPEEERADEFVQDARALLAAEYGNEPTILIKDPRLGLLAPLWHRALSSAGYRTVYLVPIRDPIEVARSLEARGDMSVPEGLALWAAYMKRIAEFAASADRVMYLRYTDLIDDWRAVVGRAVERLDLALDLDGRADAVDRYLEPGLRRQRSDAEALAALPDESPNVEVRTLYEAALARCAEDAKAISDDGGAERKRVESGAARPKSRTGTASFVLCIENNAIREQALLLCESIRQFGGRYRDAPILAFSPRAGLTVDAETRRVLAQMDVQYVDEPLNTTCLEYGPANRVFAGAWAEAHADTDFVVVLDSDTVYLREPRMPDDADVAVRPVDAKGSATRGPGDAFEDYWVALCALCGTSIDRLPYLRATIDGQRIRASYNAGLIVSRREKGILQRAADLFSRSLEAGMCPYRGSGIDIFASTGPVGQAGSEFWGSSQAVLAIAIWATTGRVVHYPASYNLPLHLVASMGEIAPEWTAEPPVHVHYHYMLSPQRVEIGMEIMAGLGVPPDRLAWLAKRVPLRDSVPVPQVA